MRTTPAMPAPEPRPTCRCRGSHEWVGGQPPPDGCRYEPGPDRVPHGPTAAAREAQATAPRAAPVAWAVVGRDVAPDDDGRLPAFISRETADRHAALHDYGDDVKPLYGDSPAPGAETTTTEETR